MAGQIKGITIQFRGETTQLDKALRKVNTESRSIDSELKKVNNALKFNPKNTELLAQKQKLLNDRVEQTSASLDELKKIQNQMDENKVDKQSTEYMNLRRQIIETESKLKHFKAEVSKFAAMQSKIRKVADAFADAGKKIEGAGRKLSGVSRAAGAVTAAMGAVTYKAGEMADDLNTLSKQTGISTDQLQMYAATADLVDVSVETMAKSQQKLKKNMLTASEGGSTLQYFEQLGVAVTDSNGELRDANEVFPEVIAALGSMENETLRDAIAMEIFGKSANELNPLIEDGGETYKEVSEMMAKYGLEPVDEESLQRANEFKDKLDTIKLLFTQAMQIVGTKIADYMLPLIEKFTAKVSKVAEWLGGLSGETLSRIMAVFSAVALLSPALIILGKVITGVGNAINTGIKVVGGLSKAISFLAANPIVLIIAGITALVAAFVILWNKSSAFRAFFITTWWKIKDAAAAAINFIITKKNQLINAFKSIPTFFSNVFGKAWSAIKSKFSAWGAFWGGLWTTIKNKFTNIGTSIASAISGAVRSGINGVISRIESIINSGISLINGAINLINKIPSVNIGKIGTLSLPRLASGGIVDSATVAMIGEGSSSEAVIPLDVLWKKLDKMTSALTGQGEGGGVVVNVYGAEGQSVASLAQEVRRVLIEEEKRRRLAWQ